MYIHLCMGGDRKIELIKNKNATNDYAIDAI